MWEKAIERLRAGEEVTIKPKGNSMTPLIKSGQPVVVRPGTPNVGDIALARVKGRIYVHLVTAIDGDRYQIGNNHGHINGWTRTVYGVATPV